VRTKRTLRSQQCGKTMPWIAPGKLGGSALARERKVTFEGALGSANAR